MSEPAAPGSPRLDEVKAVAAELLRQAGGPEVMESPLFPYGVNRIAIRVRAGEIEVSMELSGPDHRHAEEEEWLSEPEEELFEEDEEPV